MQKNPSEIHAALSPAVVSIGADHRGSGMVVGQDRVVTNAHNLRDRTTTVTFADGRAAQAAVVAADPAGDLVVLDVHTGDVQPVEFADEPPEIGGAVYAFGGTGGAARLSQGLVSGVGRQFRGPRGRVVTGALEHTAPLARGSSGGPVVDGAGHVVGVNTHRLGHGFYLAIAAGADLRRRLDVMLDGRSVEPLTLGVALASADVAARLRRSVGLSPRTGLLVRSVVDGSPAAAAGLAEGDLLVTAGGHDLAEASDLHDVLAAHDPETVLSLGVVRGSDELNVEAQFESTGGSVST